MINLFTNLRQGLALAVLFATGSLAAQAQSVGVGTTTPAASAVLDVTSTTQGQLLPRMTAAQRAAIANPVVGLFVFQTDGTPGLYYYINNSWINAVNGLVPDANGNAGASTSTQVSTVAGSRQGFADGTNSITQLNANGTSSAAQFDGPDCVIQDTYSSSSTYLRYYVADTRNNSIRIIGPSVTTLAGSGFPGSKDGTGTAAQFNLPGGVALDGTSTNLYVTDTNNQCIRKIVLSTGMVSYVTGGGFIAGTTGGTPGYVDGPNSSAMFNHPSGIIVGTASSSYSGSLLVADRDNNSIRKVELRSNGATSTLVGNYKPGFVNGTDTAARFSRPTGIAFFGSTLYVADTGNHCIRKIQGTVVTTLAGNGAPGANDGTGVVAQFNAPSGIAVDYLGNVYVADTGNNRIRKITPTGVVSTLAGSSQGNTTGTAASAQFNHPSSLFFDSFIRGTAIIVTDRDNNCIRMIK